MYSAAYAGVCIPKYIMIYLLEKDMHQGRRGLWVKVTLSDVANVTGSKPNDIDILKVVTIFMGGFFLYISDNVSIFCLYHIFYPNI